MGYLHHKGYYGSVEYSEDDKCLFGKVLGLKNSLILYEGNSIDELRADFEAGVENYLDHCKREKWEQENPYNGELNIHIPSDIHSRIAIYAENHGTSINAFIRDSIERRLEYVH